MIDSMRIGRAIKTLREKAGLTQKELAEQIFVSNMAVSKWESGKSIPDIATLKRLSKALSMDIDGLIDATATYMDDSWRGILQLKGTSASTIIYDKPLIDYALSYFLLAGIRDITVTCGTEDKEYIKERFAAGERLGIRLHCRTDDEQMREKNGDEHFMLVSEPFFIYGVDLTRFLQRGMQHRNAVVNLACVVGKYKRIQAAELLNEEKKGSFSQYDYEATPFYFFTYNRNEKGKCGYYPENYLNQQKNDGQVIYEPMDKGFLTISTNTAAGCESAAAFVKMLQELNGFLLYCPFEIAWRRGMISKAKMLEEAGAFTEYREYVHSLIS